MNTIFSTNFSYALINEKIISYENKLSIVNTHPGTINLTGFLLESPEKNDEMNESAFEEAGCKKVDPAVKKTSVLSKFGIVAKN